ncbi:DUF1534 domain-containing protein [Pseudomonas syringae]|nr:DUF1534 domain-containing protein [Pseudomonas syringae]MCF5207184.1 DUF1534 domain-containing protein [Pseudomonas syringae]MCF5216450.1 DUF1534 domain-containing protein [Pseudomonas syringae]MCF5218386.1 DUF1534 domain-containing protein [Pseudomonas syringae]MCF5268523.1 DUF1534 domain-containing protein [Pseudomonas syringae]
MISVAPATRPGCGSVRSPTRLSLRTLQRGNAVPDALRPLLSVRRRSVTRSVTKCMSTRSIGTIGFTRLSLRTSCVRSPVRMASALWRCFCHWRAGCRSSGGPGSCARS